MSLSSFYNFKAENSWEESHDFKSRVGALEKFQSEHHFKAYVSNERVEEYDLTARFNALDELEMHYHFFAQSLEYDAEYHFTGQIAPLEMEIEYEEEAEMVAVVRISNIEPITKTDVKSEQIAVIENTYKPKFRDERLVEVEQKALMETDEEMTVDLSTYENGIVNIVKDTRIESFNDGCSPTERNAVIHNLFDATHEECHGTTLEVMDEVTIDDVVELDVEVPDIAESPADILVDISSLIAANKPSVDIVELDCQFELDKMNEVNTTLEESFKAKGAAIPTYVEQDVLTESTSEFNAAVEPSKEAGNIVLHQANIEQSNELDLTHDDTLVKIEESNKATTITGDCVEVEVSLTGEKDIECLAGIEASFETDKSLEHAAEIELHHQAERTEERTVTVEQTALIERINKRYADIENWHESVSAIRFFAKIEESSKSEVDVTLNANVAGPSNAEMQNVNIAEVEQPNVAELDTERMTKLECPANVEITQGLNAEIEKSFEAKGAAIPTDIEKDINATTRNNYDAIIERQNALSPSDAQAQVEVDRSEIADEVIEFDATIEQRIESDKHSTQIAEVETPQIAGERTDFTADIEVSYESKKKLDDILNNIEEFIYSKKVNDDLVARVDNNFTARINDTLFAELEDSFDADKIQERMAEIEHGIHVDKIQGIIADLEDALDGELPKKKRDKLIWLIMGRPSWIHQYWQRTTR